MSGDGEVLIRMKLLVVELAGDIYDCKCSNESVRISIV
jgi:hypothetical protein